MRYANWIVVLTVALTSVLAIAQDDALAVLTGTVNIVLANANGIVALTDSNQTFHLINGQPLTSRFPGQKLFVIDNNTICTIAGFASTTLPNFPEFTSSAAGVLDTYIQELKDKGGSHSFHEKLTSLAFMLDIQLGGIGNLQHLAPGQIGDYGLVLILAGYDLDGSAKLGKIELSASVNDRDIFRPVVKTFTETKVGPDLAHETAGIGSGGVENILAYPSKMVDEPAIVRYAASKLADHGSSLTTAEMEELEKALAWLSAVGGPDQIAILRGGIIEKVEQPTFAERKLNMGGFTIIIGLTLMGNPNPRPDANGAPPSMSIGTPPDVLGLYLKNMFVGGSIFLDDRYYFDDDFRNATFFYDGGVLGFDPSNRLTDCDLLLGPHAGRNPAAVSKLTSRFTWRSVLQEPPQKD